MTQAQVFEEIKRWSPAEKWTLLETLLRDLRGDDLAGMSDSQPLTAQERLAIAKALHGSIRPTQSAVPSDEDVRNIIAEARIAKHG